MRDVCMHAAELLRKRSRRCLAQAVFLLRGTVSNTSHITQPAWSLVGFCETTLQDTFMWPELRMHKAV